MTFTLFLHLGNAHAESTEIKNKQKEYFFASLNVDTKRWKQTITENN